MVASCSAAGSSWICTIVEAGAGLKQLQGSEILRFLLNRQMSARCMGVPILWSPGSMVVDPCLPFKGTQNGNGYNKRKHICKGATETLLLSYHWSGTPFMWRVAWVLPGGLSEYSVCPTCVQNSRIRSRAFHLRHCYSYPMHLKLDGHKGSMIWMVKLLRQFHFLQSRWPSSRPGVKGITTRSTISHWSPRFIPGAAVHIVASWLGKCGDQW